MTESKTHDTSDRDDNFTQADQIKALVEGGHVYVEGAVMNPEAATGRDIALLVEASLKEKGYSAELAFLVDDVSLHKEWKHSSQLRYVESRGIARTLQEQYLDQGYSPLAGNRMQESRFVDKGVAVVERIKAAIANSEDFRLSEDGNSLIYREDGQKKRIKLMGYLGDQALPSCEVLDLAVYEEKLSRADVAVTVIPEVYKGQQERVHKLMSIIGEPTPIVIIYFNDEVRVVGVEAWDESLAETARNSLIS